VAVIKVKALSMDARQDLAQHILAAFHLTVAAKGFGHDGRIKNETNNT